MAARKTKNKPKVTITDEVLRQVEAYVKYGLTIEQIADILGIHRVTFHDYMTNIPILKTTIEKGRAVAHAAVGRNLFQMATAQAGTGRFKKNENGEDVEVLGPDPRFQAAAFFYAKTQMRWKETQVVEHAGGVDLNRRAEEMTPEERQARIDELLLQREKRSPAK